MNFRCKFRHRRSIRRLRFPIRVQNFSDLATFSVDFCILYAEGPPYFYFRFVWPTDLESIPRVDPYVDNSHQVWSWYDHQLPSYSVLVCWYVTWPCDLNLWPFDLEQMSYMASHVTNLATKYEDPTTILSSVTSYNGSHWLPLKMRTRPRACSESRDPWVGSRKQLHFWNPRPDLPICRFAYNFYWATTTFTLEPFSGEKNCPVEMGPKNGGFGENGGPNLRYLFRDPKRHFLARNRVVWRILRQNRCARLGGSLSQEPKK